MAEALNLARRQAKDVLGRTALGLGTLNLTPYRRRHAAETGDLQSLREGLHYSDAQRAANIFHSTFHGDPEQARPYLRNSEKMANRVYQGKPGNRDERSGDGYAYRGGGFLQVTGRGGYAAVGLEGQPDQMIRPDVVARASVDHWRQHGLDTPTYGEIESR